MAAWRAKKRSPHRESPPRLSAGTASHPVVSTLGRGQKRAGVRCPGSDSGLTHDLQVVHLIPFLRTRQHACRNSTAVSSGSRMEKASSKATSDQTSGMLGQSCRLD